MAWKWKKPQPPRPTTRRNYPDGLAVSTELENVYYIKGGKKFRCLSQRVVDSWRFDVVRGSEAALAGFPRGGTLGFRDGSLIKNIADGKMYLITGNKRRLVASPDIFDYYGLDRSSVVEVSERETMLHDEGEPIG
jgi:hypothetical protein